MRRTNRVIGIAITLIALVVVLTVVIQTATGGDVEVVKAFNAGSNELPEGIAVDKTGNIYVSLGAPAGPSGEIRKIAPDGSETTLTTYPNAGASGVAVDAPGNVYYNVSSADEATRGVYRLTGAGATERLPGTENILLPNGLGFDKQDNLYVSDSILGAVWRVPRGGAAELWFQHPSLAGCGLDPNLPPVGANGVAYWHGAIYVASTEKGLLMRIPVRPDGTADTDHAEIIAGVEDCDASLEGLDSIDGIAFDVHGNIFALLVIQHKLVKIDPATGQYTEILNADDGLFNPASLAFGTGKGDRQSVFIANFALILPGPDGNHGPAVLKVDVGVPGLPIP